MSNTNSSTQIKQPNEAELADWLSDNNIDEVECIVTDISGIVRGKAMPSYKFSKLESSYLPETIFLQTITGNYVEPENSDIYTESDLLLVPDLSTLCSVPWAREPSIQVIHDLFYRNKRPCDLAPRNVLKKVLELYDNAGLQPVLAPEMEFYLVKKNIDPDYPLEPPVGRSGRQSVGKQAYSMMSIDDYEAIIEEIYSFAGAQGLEIDTIIQEDGPAQLEINLKHGNALNLADQVFFFKRLIREAAFKHDCYATFMAKPMDDEPGSAMHIHHSILDKKTQKNIFNDEKGEATESFYHFIAGMQNYIPKAMCIFAPYINSYRRIVPDSAAPINVDWGCDNRSVGLRIPTSSPESRRVENRIVGADANPYLAIAASLACGYLGLIEKKMPRKEMKGVVSIDEAGDLPLNLRSALTLFDECEELKEVLGNRFSDLFYMVKIDEYVEYTRVVTPWERKNLLLSV